MVESSLDPIAVIATLQPRLLLWLMAIAFFVGMGGAAWFSRERTWGQVFNLFVAIFLVAWIVAIVVVDLGTAIDIVRMEVVDAGAQR